MTKHIEKNTATQVNSERIGVQVNPAILPEAYNLSIKYIGDRVTMMKTYNDKGLLATVEDEVYYENGTIESGEETWLKITAYETGTYGTDLYINRSSYAQVRGNDPIYELDQNEEFTQVTTVKNKLQYGGNTGFYNFIVGDDGSNYILFNSDTTGYVLSSDMKYVINNGRIGAIVTSYDENLTVWGNVAIGSYLPDSEQYKSGIINFPYAGSGPRYNAHPDVLIDCSEGHPAVGDEVEIETPEGFDSDSAEVFDVYNKPFDYVTSDVNSWYIEGSGSITVDGTERPVFIAMYSSGDHEGEKVYLYPNNSVTVEYDGHEYPQYLKYAGPGPEVLYSLSDFEHLSESIFYVYNGEEMVDPEEGQLNNTGVVLQDPSVSEGLVVNEYDGTYETTLESGDNQLSMKEIDGKYFLFDGDDISAVVTVNNHNYVFEDVKFSFNSPEYVTDSVILLSDETYYGIKFTFDIPFSEGHPAPGDVVLAPDDGLIPNSTVVKSVAPAGNPEEISCQVSYSVRGDNFTDVGDPLTDENNVICNIPRYVYLKFSQDVDITEE